MSGTRSQATAPNHYRELSQGSPGSQPSASGWDPMAGGRGSRGVGRTLAEKKHKQVKIEAIVRVKHSYLGRGSSFLCSHQPWGLSHLLSFLLPIPCCFKFPFDQKYFGSEERPRASCSCSILEASTVMLKMGCIYLAGPRT